ncbi:cytochrome b [Inquilinus sp.]|jgi:cytochrome b561|uniref:cytochrome b n=1 Tax=Inquilinus sp. TaxID=1932117 RepID=UPI003783BC1F
MSTEVMIAAAPRAATGRYTAAAQGLHWVSAALMLAVLVLAWVMESLPNNDSTRATVVMLHKSVGLTILALTVARLAWRAIHPPPPAARWAAWEAAAAMASHWLLYLVLLAMPISGYLMSAGRGRAIPYFGLFEVPLLTPATDAIWRIGATVHWAGQWALYTLVALHIAAAVWHVAIRRDGTLDRMLPEQSGP